MHLQAPNGPRGTTGGGEGLRVAVSRGAAAARTRLLLGRRRPLLGGVVLENFLEEEEFQGSFEARHLSGP